MSICLGPRLNAETYETAVHGENLLVNNRSNGKTVEAIGKGLPQLDVITSFACRTWLSTSVFITILAELTFIVETVDSVDAGAFVVSSQDEEVFWVFDL